MLVVVALLALFRRIRTAQSRKDCGSCADLAGAFGTGEV